jgi:hypothetical protein
MPSEGRQFFSLFCLTLFTFLKARWILSALAFESLRVDVAEQTLKLLDFFVSNVVPHFIYGTFLFSGLLFADSGRRWSSADRGDR